MGLTAHLRKQKNRGPFISFQANSKGKAKQMKNECVYIHISVKAKQRKETTQQTKLSKKKKRGYIYTLHKQKRQREFLYIHNASLSK